jgi:hypothetical protein
VGVDKSSIVNFIKERGGFTMVPNELWTVDHLDSIAKHIWCYIYSLPSDWSSSRNNLYRNLNMSNNTVSAHIEKLVGLNMLIIKKGKRNSWNFKILPPSCWNVVTTGAADALVLNRTGAADAPVEALTGAADASVLVQQMPHIKEDIKRNNTQEEQFDSAGGKKSFTSHTTHADVLHYWNDVIAAPKAKALTKPRIAKLKVRMSEKEFAENWKQIIDQIDSSDFLSGRGGNKWRATFDWMIDNASNYIKVLEGNYGSTPTKKLVDW